MVVSVAGARIVADVRRKRDLVQGQLPTSRPLPIAIGNSTVQVYTEGEDLFSVMLYTIRAAREQILFETYIWKDDIAGQGFKHELDGETAFVGGYNIGATYATEWRCTQIRVSDPHALGLKNVFVDFWNMHRTMERRRGVAPCPEGAAGSVSRAGCVRDASPSPRRRLFRRCILDMPARLSGSSGEHRAWSSTAPSPTVSI